MLSLLYTDTLAQIVADLEDAQRNGDIIPDDALGKAKRMLVKVVGENEAQRLIDKEAAR